MLLTTIAFILSNVGARWCRFLYKVNGSGSMFSGNIGLWGYEANGVCYAYPSNMPTDTKFNAARVFSTWTTVVGIVVLVLTWFSVCSGLSRAIWSGMGFFLFVNSLFEGLTLLMKQSDICDGLCTLSTGAKCCISAIVFWFLAAISVATVPPPAGPEPIVIQETTTTTTRVEPDGTQVTETKVDKKVVPSGFP
jgi:hypothetical protein